MYRVSLLFIFSIFNFKYVHELNTIPKYLKIVYPPAGLLVQCSGRVSVCAWPQAVATQCVCTGDVLEIYIYIIILYIYIYIYILQPLIYGGLCVCDLKFG